MIWEDQYIIFRETGSTDPRACGGGGGHGGSGCLDLEILSTWHLLRLNSSTFLEGVLV